MYFDGKKTIVTVDFFIVTNMRINQQMDDSELYYYMHK